MSVICRSTDYSKYFNESNSIQIIKDWNHEEEYDANFDGDHEARVKASINSQ
jgi:hypothetical protein